MKISTIYKLYVMFKKIKENYLLIFLTVTATGLLSLIVIDYIQNGAFALAIVMAMVGIAYKVFR